MIYLRWHLSHTQNTNFCLHQCINIGLNKTIWPSSDRVSPPPPPPHSLSVLPYSPEVDASAAVVVLPFNFRRETRPLLHRPSEDLSKVSPPSREPSAYIMCSSCLSGGGGGRRRTSMEEEKKGILGGKKSADGEKSVDRPRKVIRVRGFLLLLRGQFSFRRPTGCNDTLRAPTPHYCFKL